MIDYKTYALKICESEINRRKLVKPDGVVDIVWRSNWDTYLRDYMKDLGDRIRPHLENTEKQIMEDNDLKGTDKGKYFRDIMDAVINRVNKHEKELRENRQ